MKNLADCNTPTIFFYGVGVEIVNKPITRVPDVIELRVSSERFLRRRVMGFSDLQSKRYSVKMTLP